MRIDNGSGLRPVGWLRALVLAVLVGAGAPVLAQTTYSGMWWDASKSGMGVGINQQGTTLFVVWYAYGADGKPVWLQMGGDLANAATFSGTLYTYTGTPFGAGYNPAAVTPTAAGTATLSFSGGNSATLTYDALGRSGSLSLTRFSFGRIALGGTYYGGAVVSGGSCSTTAYQAIYAITHTGNTVTYAEYSDDAICSGGGSLAQAGEKYLVTGNFSCNNGRGGTLAGEVAGTDRTFTFSGSLAYTLGLNCTATAVFGGIR